MKTLLNWKGFVAAFCLMTLYSLTGCGKNHTSTVPKPDEKIVSVTKQKTEFVPVLEKKVTTTTYGADGKPVAPKTEASKGEVPK